MGRRDTGQPTETHMSRIQQLLCDAAGIALLDEVMCNVIRAHVGKPCPTRREFMALGVPRRMVWMFLADMQARGVIEIEEEREEAPHYPVRRRMRVCGETSWTLWTSRPGRPKGRQLTIAGNVVAG